VADEETDNLQMKLERHIMKHTRAVLMALGVIVNFTFIGDHPAYSQQVLNLIGYDIQNAAESGFGAWDHRYNGLITPTGSNLVVAFPNGKSTAVLALYTGGGGTLNDGQVGLAPGDTELFATAAQPVITLHLGNTYAIQSINLESFSLYNGIPGNITGVNLAVGGSSASFQPTTTTDDANNLSSSLIDLTSSPVAGITGDTIVLSGFSPTWRIRGGWTA
jgi:hypothetical protein